MPTPTLPGTSVCHKLYYRDRDLVPRDILSWFYDIVLGDTMGFVSVQPELKINRKCIAKVMSLIHVKPFVFQPSSEIIIFHQNLFFNFFWWILESWENFKFFGKNRRDSWDSRDFSSSLAQKNLESQVAPNVVRYETNLKLDWQKLNPIRTKLDSSIRSDMGQILHLVYPDSKFECDKKDAILYTCQINNINFQWGRWRKFWTQFPKCISRLIKSNNDEQNVAWCWNSTIGITIKWTARYATRATGNAASWNWTNEPWSTNSQSWWTNNRKCSYYWCNNRKWWQHSAANKWRSDSRVRRITNSRTISRTWDHWC